MKRKIVIEQSEPSCKKVHANVNHLTGEPYTEHYHQLLETRKKLPAYESRHKLLQLLEEYQVIILVG